MLRPRTVSLLEIGAGTWALINWGIWLSKFGLGTPLDFFAIVAAVVIVHGLYNLLRRA
jgi:hypothetical protein